MLTPWSVFEDGSLMTIMPASLRSAYRSPPKGIVQQAITLPEESYVPEAFVPDSELMLA
ncbi:hypothetical protein PC113_g25789 [Phytophthora cactorum]|uniref:Uncharacterized protein n=1 Tax=Phytophthora cactorum TaxID=29920 RepID=A0A8T0XN29_9STRA|nr:hypothetical protein PC113_g25789 [Phytophthora cactorum]